MCAQKNGQVTIAQVAREAGVSMQTVSRVINNRQEITSVTRQRVQEVIEKLGYHPNVLARSLSQRRSHTLGVAAAGIEYYGPSRTLIGIDQAANRLGFSIVLSLIHEPEDGNVERVFHSLISRQVEGIIWQVPEIGDNRAWLHKEVQRHAIPVIFTDTHPDKKLNTIAIDNHLGGRLATEHLLSRGYRSIGLICGPQRWRSALERRRGWEDALKAAHVAIDEQRIAEGDWTPGSGERAFQKLMGTFPEMDAVVVSNDQMALGVYQAAWRMGKRIPEDLAVVGFDDIPEAAFFSPQLTTVRQDLFELGSKAVEALAKILEAGRTDQTDIGKQGTILPPELIVRQSS